MNSSLDRLFTHLRDPLHRNGYALIVSVGINAGLGMLFWILAARNYSADVIGINSALISALTFLTYLSQLNLTNGLNRFLPTAGSASKKMLGYAFSVSLLVTLIFSLIFVMTVEFWVAELSFLGSTTTFALWFIVASLAQTVFTLQDSSLVGLRKAVWVTIKNLFFGVLKIGLLFLFVTILPDYGVFASWNIAAIVTIFPVIILIFIRSLLTTGLRDLSPGCWARKLRFS